MSKGKFSSLLAFDSLHFVTCARKAQAKYNDDNAQSIEKLVLGKSYPQEHKHSKDKAAEMLSSLWYTAL